MSAHSKGPWRADGISVLSESGRTLAVTVKNDVQPIEQAQANARLMAAAPELYDALELVLAVHAETLGDDLGMQVVAALKKARGDQ